MPQWNCRCRYCEAVRRGILLPRLQAAAAISPDGSDWYLINATPDVATQLARSPQLHPREGLRHAPFRGVLLTDGEFDHTLGLLHLREGLGWTLYGTRSVTRLLETSFPVLPALRRYADPDVQEIQLDEPVSLGSEKAQLVVRWVETGQDPPRYTGMEEELTGAVTALIIEDSRTGRSLAYAPGVRDLTDELFARLRDVDVVCFDGTFWTDDELSRLSGSPRSALDMGHVPMSGPNGSAAWLAKLPAQVKRYVHLNNSNPVLDPTSEQRRHIRELGLDVAEDGDEMEI